MRTLSAPHFTRPATRQIVLAGGAIFLIAFGVRLLMWQDTRLEVGKVQTVVADNYKTAAKHLSEGGVSGFFSASGPLANLNVLGHPPGYSILIASITRIYGESNTAVQMFQITCDALSAVVIFLIALELFPLAVGLIAGILAALSPQFAWNSVLLLPDTLAVLPLLLAIYLLARALRKPRLLSFLSAGALIGLSCWLRANALFMSPFLALMVLLPFEKERRLRFAGAVLLGALVVIAPITIRNWIVTRQFIPVSLGAGQTMLEGIADYDPTQRFGIPDTDMAIMKMEAEQYHRPDYYSTLFEPDGVIRERLRLSRAFGIVRAHPFWFAGVMARRAFSMLRLERARLIAATPAVSLPLKADDATRVWTGRPTDLVTTSEKSPDAQVSLGGDSETLRLLTDSSKSGVQLKLPTITTLPHHDYLLRVPVQVEQGRVIISASGSESAATYVSTVVDQAEVKIGDKQPRRVVDLPFVSSERGVNLLFANAGASLGRSLMHVGSVEVFDLGRASLLWTRYPRQIVRALQQLLITAVMLPLALIGTLLLIWRREWVKLALLWSVPFYYFCFQSMLHTEYRYVLAIHYFLFVLASVALYEVGCRAWRLPSRRSTK